MKVAIIANTKKEGILIILPPFLEDLKKNNIDAVLHESLKNIVKESYTFSPVDKLFDDVDMIISFGGDGTILHTAQISLGTNIPILGVNLGKVGFLAEISPDEILSIPEKLKTGNYQILERMAFTAETSSGDKYFALNDIVVDRNADTRILELSVSVDGIHAGDFAADGIIVSTPTGSTAHSVSAGGPLVMPECFVTVLTPICPHSLTLRPMIIDGSKEICLKVLNGIGRMAVDGQSFVDVSAGSEVSIEMSKKAVKIARFDDKTYFDILHTRLNWGVSPKLKNA
ncbi:NAD(+)/NADH kinase [Candidatus Latescibacterota bacterium]